jgi:hypothetical protein
MKDYHSPKNVAEALLVETCQLASNFRWMSPRDSIVLAYQESRRNQLAGQMAEVMYLLVRLADELGIDLASAALQRLSRQTADKDCSE